MKIAFECFDYSRVTGDTGPVVYPAGHLYSYGLLYWLLGDHCVTRWQYAFALLYLAQLAILISIYRRTLKEPKLPILLLCLSKRLHSIFVLRLFNDPIAIFFVVAAIHCMISGRNTISVLLLSLGLSVKMNVLLFMPAVALIWWRQAGLRLTVKALLQMAFLQLFIGAPFLWRNPWAYLRQSFDFGRQFDYRWTVNWRFISRHLFESELRGKLLLAVHVCSLLVWLWKRRRSSNVFQLMAECNLIGIICARTLHYQFYSWYHFTIPWLLWKSREMPMWLRLLLYIFIEVCWNIYPSTSLSSATLLLANLTLLLWPK